MQSSFLKAVTDEFKKWQLRLFSKPVDGFET